jgi:hypothetical protein
VFCKHLIQIRLNQMRKQIDCLDLICSSFVIGGSIILHICKLPYISTQSFHLCDLIKLIFYSTLALLYFNLDSNLVICNIFQVMLLIKVANSIYRFYKEIRSWPRVLNYVFFYAYAIGSS